MHQAAVIRLRNKMRPESMTEPLQIDPAMDAVSLTSYLNTLLGAAAEYLFYYQNTRLTRDVATLIEKHALDIENTLVIDYLNIGDQTADLHIPCDDVVTALLHFKGRLYARLYGGGTLEYDLCGEHAPRKYGNMTEMASGENIYGVLDGAITDLETKVAVLKSGYEDSLFIATSEDTIAVGATKKKIRLFRLRSSPENGAGDASSGDCCAEDVYAEDFYRGVQLTKDALYWIESLDVVVRYDLSTRKKDTFYVRQTVTSLAVADGVVFCTTSNNMLVKIENKTLQSYDISIRSVDRLIPYQNTLILVSQHNIVSLDTATMEEKAYLFLDEQVNAAALGSGRLFVGNGSKISGYDLSRLV